jgi:hypothetical protein
MSYSDLLKDPRWQRKRLEVLEAAGWACERCDRDDLEMHVHHPRYVRGRMPWEYEIDELEALCKPCHDDATEWAKKLDALVEKVKLCGRCDVEEAVGYLSAMVANSFDDVASGHLIEIVGCEDATGAGKYILGPTQADSWVREHLSNGKIDAYKLRSDFVRSAFAHRRIKASGR